MLCILLRFGLMHGAQSLSVVDEGNVLGALEGTRSAPLILYDHGAIQIYLLTYLRNRNTSRQSIDKFVSYDNIAFAELRICAELRDF